MQQAGSHAIDAYGHRSTVEQIYTGTDCSPLLIPEEAVVVPGSRAVSHPVGRRWNLSLYTPVIVKYRDARTDERVQLESLSR